jgi:hypothetical protein
MTAIRRTLLVALICAAGVIRVGDARADAIDGNWCTEDGKRMSIQGPDIVIPSGKRIRGDYDRHGFAYVVPDGDPGAGEMVSIILLSEYLAHARQGGTDAPLQVWKRCSPGISRSRHGPRFS